MVRGASKEGMKLEQNAQGVPGAALPREPQELEKMLKEHAGA